MASQEWLDYHLHLQCRQLFDLGQWRAGGRLERGVAQRRPVRLWCINIGDTYLFANDISIHPRSVGPWLDAATKKAEEFPRLVSVAAN